MQSRLHSSVPLAWNTGSVDEDWLTVAAAAVCLIFSVGTMTLYSFGVFIRPLSASFHWTRGQVSMAVAIGQYSFAAASVLWGWLVDRFGPRRTIPSAVIGLAVGVSSLRFLGPNLWQLYVTFALIPFLAGGASPLGYAAVLIRRFERRLGLALGLSLMGVGLGATILPVLAQYAIVRFGWRGAYGILGALTFLITFPSALLATRNSQERATRAKIRAASTDAPELRLPAMILMCIVFLLIGIASVGTLAHLVPMMIDHGFSANTAARVAAATGFATIISRGGIGTLMDRFFAPYVLAIVSLVGGAGCALLALSSGRTENVIAALMLGLLVGAEVDFIAYFVRRYFPLQAFGKVYGLVFGLFIVGSGTGPLVLGQLFDRHHSYKSGLFAYAMLAVVAAILASLMPRYHVVRDR